MTDSDDARDLAYKRLKAQRAFKGTLLTAVLVLAIVTAIWALSGGGYFWPIWVVFGLGIALITTGWSAYGPGQKAITDADVDREVNRSK